MPWDKVVDLSDSALLPGFSETQKRELLSKPWNGYDDFNPNRILTATWKKDTNKWYGHDGITPLDQPLNDPANTSTNFTLPQSLTAGQNYNFAVESVSNSGAVTKDFGQFKTLPPVSNSPFSSVSVLTHGFTLLPNQSGIPDSFFQMANKIATVSGNTPENSGLIMRYDKPTGNWIPIDLQGRVITDLTEGLKTSETAYLSTLANNLKAGVFIDGKEIKYLNNNKPLVLLTEWSLDRESVIPDVGFSEGAADALFASMVQLDLALGGKVGEYENNQLQRLYDSQGNLIRQQGDLFNSPMHFMGFSRGTVVNSEIVQRLGTFFPQAGGTSMANRDLQMTTIDPHDFYQPSLNLRLPGFIETNFSDFYEPKIQVWNNVTFADNYYQTVADPNGGTATPNGRSLSQLPQEELDKNPKPAGLNFPKASGDTLGKADREILLGTRNGEPDRINSRIGFTKDDSIGGTHKRAFGWYAGTVDLDLEEVLLQYPHVEASENPQAVNDMLGKMGLPEMFDPNFPAAKPWYDNGNGEGVGEGWFYSVLGGGKEQRQYSPTGRVPVSFDNTLSAGMRGDYAVPTLFNGNFDQFIPNKSVAEDFGRNAISQVLPGWSFHNNSPQVTQGSTSNLLTVENLVDWRQVGSLQKHREKLGYDGSRPNYALELGSDESITHNRFVVPDWGVLRFDLHVPNPGNGKLKVFIKEANADGWTELNSVDLSLADDPHTLNPNDNNQYVRKNAIGYYDFKDGQYSDPYSYKLSYAREGFETFHLDVPNHLRGKPALLKFELEGNSLVYLDDVFFKSAHLKLDNPDNARPDASKNTNNYLIERPQYSLSYNNETKGANWVSWQLNKAWLGDVRRQRITGEPNNPDHPYVEQVPIVSYGNSYGRNYPPGFDDGGLDSNFPQSPDQVRPVDATFSPYDINNGNVVVYPWVPDGLLPANWVRTQGGDYRNNTLYVPGGFVQFADRRYEKGHLAPIEDRTRTFKDALSTYMTSNLLPFQHYVNKTPWKNFEEESNKFVQGNNAELYIIAGATGYNLDRKLPDPYPTEHPFQSHPDPLPGVVKNLVSLREQNGELIFDRDPLGRIRTRNGGNEGINFQWLTNPKQIGIPEFFWKVVVPLRPGQGIADLNEDTQPIAVIMPNIDARKFPDNQLILGNDTTLDLSRPGVWETYAVTVRDVEHLTGYNFFSGLPQELQDAIEEDRNTNFFLNPSP